MSSIGTVKSNSNTSNIIQYVLTDISGNNFVKSIMTCLVVDSIELLGDFTA